MYLKCVINNVEEMRGCCVLVISVVLYVCCMYRLIIFTIVLLNRLFRNFNLFFVDVLYVFCSVRFELYSGVVKLVD